MKPSTKSNLFTQQLMAALCGLLFLFTTSCSTELDESIAENQPAPQLSSSPSPALLNHMVQFIGSSIDENAVELMPSMAIWELAETPTYVHQSATNQGKFWFVPIEHNVLTTGARITYRVPASVKPFYQNADFVLVATVADATHPYSLGVRVDQQATCVNGACVTRPAISDATAAAAPALCSGIASCSPGNHSNSVNSTGDTEFKLCRPRQCSMSGSCITATIRVPKNVACPTDACQGPSDCEGGQVTCYYNKCEKFGTETICQGVSLMVDSESDCPPDECTQPSDCQGNGNGGGDLGTILGNIQAE